MDRNETKKILKEFCAVYPNHFKEEQIPTVLNLWVESMQNAEYKYAHQALTELLRECDRPPTVAQIFKRAIQCERLAIMRAGGHIDG